MPSGTGTTRPAGIATSSAKAPRAPRKHTAWPTAMSVTAFPLAMTVPPASPPSGNGMSSGLALRKLLVST